MLVCPGRNISGFVKMDSEKNRTAAIEALNGHSLHDNKLKLRASKNREGKKLC